MTVLPEKEACHKMPAFLNVAGGTASLKNHLRREHRPREGQRWTQSLPAKARRPGPARRAAGGSQRAPWAQEPAGGGRAAGANRLFCSVSCSRAPVGLPDTCGSAHSSGSGHSWAEPAGPGSVLFRRRGEWARQAYFWNSGLAGVLRRGREDLLVALRGSGRSLGSGFCLRVRTGLGPCRHLSG